MVKKVALRNQNKVSTSETAAPFVPESKSIPILREAVQSCRGCGLYKTATQAVFGEGPKSAHILFVGEQPGDHEDLEGHPFIGPAGKLLSESLKKAGIDRKSVYVTNAVKHFKWEPKGKIRLHAKPRASEIKACFPWLRAELDAIKPEFVVCLGATAAQAVFGKATPVMANRQKWLQSPVCENTLVTVHPSSILRAPDPEMREQSLRNFIDDLKLLGKKALLKEK